MGAAPSSSAYDQERRRAAFASTRRMHSVSGASAADAAYFAATHGGLTAPPRRRMTLAKTRSNTIVETGGSGVMTPFELRQMMMAFEHKEEEEEEEEIHSDQEHHHVVDSEGDELEARSKMSVGSADSGLDSDGMSPRGSIDEENPPVLPTTSAIIDDKKEEKKRKGSRLTRKARKIGTRIRSRSIGALFSSSDKPAPLFGRSLISREWEIVTVQEMCRRLSLDHLDVQDMPIPEGASASVILDELMIRQIMEILPARAEGYPWVNIYNSEKHGFSLATLYRKMAEFDEDMSPILLIIRDTRDHIFGAVVSSAIRPSDGFIGTGDSCLLWRFTGEAPHTRELRHYAWTGENQFFVHATKECLSIGAGHGHNGLWVDADVNHGRSQKCATFDNEPLTGDSEDFIVQFVEAYGFRI